MGSKAALVILSTTIEDFGYNNDGKARAIQLSTLVSEGRDDDNEWFMNPKVFPSHVRSLNDQQRFLINHPDIVGLLGRLRETQESIPIVQPEHKESGKDAADSERLPASESEEEMSVRLIVCADTVLPIIC